MRCLQSSFPSRALGTVVLGLTVACGASGCGDRPDIWNASAPSSTTAVGLSNAVAVVDDAAHRVVMLTVPRGTDLVRTPIAVGHGVARTAVSRDLSKLFVLSAGDFPRRGVQDERPSLSVIEATASGFSARRYTLPTPLSGISVDPLGRWVALYSSGSNSKAFVENANEVTLVDLTASTDTAVVSRTLRSFGGQPQRISFTPALSLPGGSRRLLVVETEQDVSLVDLDHARDATPRPEITVRLTSGGDSRIVSPAGVVVDDGDPARNDDARIGIRLAGQTSIITLDLVAASGTSADGAGGNDFSPKINMTEVGGVASDLAFVHTDGGLRLAALVPSKRSAVLVDPTNGSTATVTLPQAYQRLSLITDTVPADGSYDVALLWNATSSANGVAFWALGKAQSQSYRSIEALGLSASISEVLDVPKPLSQLKILRAASNNVLYVLDLLTRTVAPLSTNGRRSHAYVSPDGQRLWLYADDASVAAISLQSIHPTPFYVPRLANGLFEVGRGDGGRAMIAIHTVGTAGATVADAQAADGVSTRGYAGLLLEHL